MNMPYNRLSNLFPALRIGDALIDYQMIIGLPANLFYGTGIPARILVLDKENASAHKGIKMIDASKGFFKDGNKNRLREQDIHRTVDTFRKLDNVDAYARIEPLSEIASEKNNYNLSRSRYIDSAEILQDDAYLIAAEQASTDAKQAQIELLTGRTRLV